MAIPMGIGRAIRVAITRFRVRSGLGLLSVVWLSYRVILSTEPIPDCEWHRVPLKCRLD